MKTFLIYKIVIILTFLFTSNIFSQIVFFSLRDSNAEIYTIEEDGSNLQRLTNNSVNDGSPAWSPDGTQIAFSSTRSGNRNLYIMNSDGSNQVRISTSSAYESHPDWSPDGNRISFTSERDGNDEIYIMNIDGSNLIRLTNHPADDQRPDWSPDGEQIVFNSYRDDNWEIYCINADGSNLHRVTTSAFWEIFPTWSPDGTRFAYFRATPNQWDQEIYVMNIDGTNVQQLTNLQSAISENPAWSPDGSQIVFQSDRDGNFEIYIMNSDGSNQQRVTTHSAGDYWPSWQPEVTSVNFNLESILKNIHLNQNYPNPFNPVTTIEYQIPDLNLVTLKVYDVLGNEIATLVNEKKPAGSYEVEFSAKGLTSGIYFYKISTRRFIKSKKMMLLR